MNTQQYKIQLKELLDDLNNIAILKRPNETTDILDGKEIVADSKQFLNEVSDIKKMILEIREVIYWIEGTVESDKD